MPRGCLTIFTLRDAIIPLARISPKATIGGRGGACYGGMLRGAYSFVARLSHLTIDHASRSRRSTVPSPNGDTSNVWALITLFPYVLHKKMFAFPSPVLFQGCDKGVAYGASFLLEWVGLTRARATPTVSFFGGRKFS